MTTVCKYPKPIPEKFQRKARLRRLKQQYRGFIDRSEYIEACRQVEKDYKKKR